MKGKLFVWIFGIMLSSTMLAGCHEVEKNSEVTPSSQSQTIQKELETTSATHTKKETQEKVQKETKKEIEIDYTEVYHPILEEMCQLIVQGTEQDEITDGQMGVFEATIGLEKEEALNHIGYIVQDISGDEIPELIIGGMTEKKDEMCYGKEIYAIYTCVEGKPQFVLEGRSRSSHSMMNDGRFLYQGSNGAMSSLFGTYTLSLDGTALQWQDFYFTDEKEASLEEIGFYHNTSGIWDQAASEEMNVSEEEFWKILEDLERQTQMIELVPFSAYRELNEPVQTQPKVQVEIQWFDEVKMQLKQYDEFVADTTEPQSKIVFSTKSNIKDFKVLSLTMAEVNEKGEIHFTTEELYSQKELTPENALVVTLTFVGEIPNYGIAYVESDGIVKQFAVAESGKDGSLLLMPFN